MDDRLPDDTIYWIIEEDFRFWPPGQDPDGADNHWELVEERYKLPKEGGAGSSLPPSHDTAKTDEARVHTEFHMTHAAGHSDEGEENQGFCRDVIDMMRIATMCHRNGMGEFIWVSWVPSKKSPSRIGHGSQCLMMTKDGVFACKDAKDRGVLTRGHIDLVLQSWLRKPDEAQKAKACYIYPPIGSYTEHPSECDPKNFGGDKTRPSGFDSGENPCHGTRNSGDPKGREKAIIQWRPGWKDRPWIPFETEAELHHTDRFLWKSIEGWWCDTHIEHMPERPNPGKTSREKRMYRAFRTRMMKRNWVKNRDEAKCFVWGGQIS